MQFVPPLAVLLIKGKYLKKYDLSHVQMIVCGAAPLSDDVLEELHSQFRGKVDIRQGRIQL